MSGLSRIFLANCKEETAAPANQTQGVKLETFSAAIIFLKQHRRLEICSVIEYAWSMPIKVLSQGNLRPKTSKTHERKKIT